MPLISPLFKTSSCGWTTRHEPYNNGGHIKCQLLRTNNTFLADDLEPEKQKNAIRVANNDANQTLMRNAHTLLLFTNQKCHDAIHHANGNKENRSIV
jgi:hypothetical protein